MSNSNFVGKRDRHFLLLACILAIFSTGKSVAAKQHFVPRALTANPMTEDFAGSSHKLGKLCMSRGYNMPLDMPILLLAFHEA